jgi:hypothetical protein
MIYIYDISYERAPSAQLYCFMRMVMLHSCGTDVGRTQVYNMYSPNQVLMRHPSSQKTIEYTIAVAPHRELGTATFVLRTMTSHS